MFGEARFDRSRGLGLGANDEGQGEVERLRAELAAARERLAEADERAERYRGVVEKSVDYIVIHQDGQIVFANPAAVAALGFGSVEELLGRSPLDFVAPESRAVVAERMRMALQDGADLQPLTERYLSPAGRSIIGEVVARRVSWRGRPAGLVVVHDVTERVRAEQERARLQARVARAEKLQSLGLMAAEVAHDFNNLLNAVRGNAGLAAAELPAATPARKHLDRLDVAVRQAGELIQQLQAVAGAEAAETGPIDLAALVRETIEPMRADLDPRIALSLELDADIPPVDGDRTRLRQVVANLVRNGADAIGDRSGQIAIHLESKRLAAAELGPECVPAEAAAGRYVSLAVTDDGCGIDEQTQNRVFDPFYSTKSRGRGLGLATVLGIVRSHGGVVCLHSIPDDGTTVEVLLPPASKAAAG